MTHAIPYGRGTGAERQMDVCPSEMEACPAELPNPYRDGARQ